MIIITGGAGFIGSAVLWQLNNLGFKDIIVVDNLAETQKWRNLVKRVYADYLHRDKFISMVRLKALPWKVDAIIHLGACSSTTETNADFLMENNFHYSRDLCQFAIENDARFINASSAATYGAGENGFSDDMALVPKLNPLNMYGYSKQLFDLWLLKEHLENRIVSLKFFNVYGPNEYHKGNMRSVVAKAYDEINRTGKATLYASSVPGLADGEQKRDFVYVKDCASLIGWLLLDGKQVCGIHNVGTGQARSFRELADSVFRAMDKPIDINYIAMPDSLAKNYQNYTCADMRWLEKANYPVKFSNIESGIKDYICNYLAKSDNYL